MSMSRHNALTRKNGDVYVWGYNGYGQLGDGTKVDILVPTLFPTRWKSIGTSYNNSFAIDNEGYLYMWGYNGQGQIGDNTTVDKAIPTKVGNLKWKMVDSQYYTLGITEDGDLYAWGDNSTGQLGNGTTVDNKVPTKIGNLKWKTVATGMIPSSGYSWSMAITEDGDLYGWGINNESQLGDGTTESIKSTPTKIGSLKWKTVSTGANHTLGITEDGDLYAWGSNTYGQLGDGTTVIKKTPTKIGNLKWKFISVGQYFTTGITEDGDLYAWGVNNEGQLGDGTTENKLVPTKISDLKWQFIKAEQFHTVAIDTKGDLYTWGYNGYGQLGDGTTENKLVPTKVFPKFWVLDKTLILHNGEYKKITPEEEQKNNEALIPKLTGANSQVISIGEYATAYASWKAFDREDGYGWLYLASSIGYIGYNFKEETSVKSFSIKGRNQDANDSTGLPTVFSIQYSNDLNQWTEIKEFNYNSWTAGLNNDLVHFNLDEAVKARAFRLYIKETVANTGIIVGELQFYSPITPFKNRDIVTASSTLPTSTQFLSDGMDSLSPLLDRRIEALVPQPMLNKTSILFTNGEEGKVFSKTLDLKKYIDIRSIRVGVE